MGEDPLDDRPILIGDHAARRSGPCAPIAPFFAGEKPIPRYGKYLARRTIRIFHGERVRCTMWDIERNPLFLL
jgi:hypothetical protein